VTHDVAFGVDQLVEIAIRALSPAVNDTFTALTCIDWLSDCLCKIAPVNRAQVLMDQTAMTLRANVESVPDESDHAAVDRRYVALRAV
jgi:uncharacterized membrane protein